MTDGIEHADARESNRFPIWLMVAVGIVSAYLIITAVVSVPKHTAPLTPEQEQQQQVNEETAWWLLIASNF